MTTDHPVETGETYQYTLAAVRKALIEALLNEVRKVEADAAEVATYGLDFLANATQLAHKAKGLREAVRVVDIEISRLNGWKDVPVAP